MVNNIIVSVVDDDPRVVESLVNLLAAWGVAAEGYHSAEDFLRLEGDRRSRCVITDIGMKQMSGLDLLQHIQKGSNPVPVILITGKPSMEGDSFYLGKGAIGFFRKPVDDAALERLLSSILR